MIRRPLSHLTRRTDRVGGKPVTVTDETHTWHIWDGEDERETARGLDQIGAFLADYRRQRELDLVDDLDLPIKLRQASRRRVLDGESLAQVYRVNREADL